MTPTNNKSEQTPRPGKNMQGKGRPQRNRPRSKTPLQGGISRASRSQAIRSSRQNHDDAQLQVSKWLDSSQMEAKGRANKIDDSPKLKIVGLGGMDGGGSKNMIVVEYGTDAVVIDCGNDLGVDLPGINFGIPDFSYLREIKHKLKAVLITHGHLDHIGGLPYLLPEFDLPVYGSKFTIGMVEQIVANSDHVVEGFKLKTIVVNQDSHEKIKIGKNLAVEFVRVTHSIPDSTAVVLDTPEGKVINTGDYRIDPEPLDHKQTDIDRFKELGKEGVTVLMSDSTTGERPGRTPSEHTLQKSFDDLFDRAPGRVFVATFSTNINRIQMIVNSAVEHGRKIALDGRSMMTTLETAVKLGFIKIPKGTFIPMKNAGTVKDDNLVVVCTGSQGEPNSALVRMSKGDHKYVNLKAQDTVILSSNPIPESGNDALIGEMVDNLVRQKVHVFRDHTKELDGSGPLHVSGHASLEEYGDMVDFTKPKYFMPIYGSIRAKQYLIGEAINRGIPRENTINAENGQVIEFGKTKLETAGVVPYGTMLVDNSGTIVSNIVAKDRLMLAQEGLVSVILTVNKKTGKLMSSPDIITRGFIYMRENEELMENFRSELKRVVAQRFGRVDLDRFKQELKDHITYYLYGATQRSPIVIPVVNVIGGSGDLKKQEARRAEMRSETSHD